MEAMDNNTMNSTRLEHDSVSRVAAMAAYINGAALFVQVFCLLGLVGNILCIYVLIKSKLVKQPVNILLTGLSVSDILTLIGYNALALYVQPLVHSQEAQAEGPNKSKHEDIVFALIVGSAIGQTTSIYH